MMHTNAEVAEQADALRSGRSPHCEGVGSTPTFGTTQVIYAWVFLLSQSSACGRFEGKDTPIEACTAMDEFRTPPPSSRPPRRQPQQITSLQIVFALILSIGLLLVINFSGRIARGQQMEIERKKLQATIDVLEAQKIELQKEYSYAASDASVEYWAHTQGKMVRDGEVLVIPVPAGITEPTPVPPAPVLIATPIPEPETPNWRLWWNLFFDGDPPF
jgi:hypothetical protein